LHDDRRRSLLVLPSLRRKSGLRGRTALRGPLRTAGREVRDLAWLPWVFSRGQASPIGRLGTDLRQSDGNTSESRDQTARRTDRM